MSLVESPFFFSKNQVIQAGAGTGKTHTLVTQYLHLCLGATAYKKPLDPACILVVTFTEKAAAELQERVSVRLQRMRRLLSESSPDSWTDTIEQVEPELAETMKTMGVSLGAARIDEVLLQLETAPLGTFHSFAANLLRRYSKDRTGALFELLLPADAFEWERTAARQVLLRAIEGGYEDPQLPLVLSVKEAKELISQFGFFDAYKGGGLPEMMISVNARIREEGKPWMHAFSTSQMDECQRYVPSMCLQATQHIDALSSMQGELGKNSVGLWKECEEKYRDLFSFFSKTPTLSQFLQQQESVLSMWQQFCSDLSGLRSQKQEPSQKRLASIKEFFKQALKEATAIVTSQKAQPLLHALQKICILSAQAYQKEKQDNHRLDFSDLLQRARDLLLQNPDVCMQVKSQLKVILVDEFQDTSPLQSEILSLLSFGMPLPAFLSSGESLLEKEGTHVVGKIAIVGDRKQSIYQFRGADVASFLEISQKLLQVGAQQTVLQQSRRSLPGILDFSNAFFSKRFVAESSLVDARHGTTSPLWRVLWDPLLDPLLPCREPQSDSCVDLLFPGSEQVHEQDPLRREALLIATRIQQLIESGRSPSEIVILFRRMTHLSTYLDVLSQQGIKPNVVHGRGYYQTREVWDLLLALVLIAEPENQLALISVLRSPLVGLFDDHLVLLKQSGRLSLSALCSLDANEIPSLPKDAFDHLILMSKLFSHFAMCADRMGPATVLSALVSVSDFLQILEALPLASQRLSNVEQLLQMAQDFEMQGQSFQEFVALMQHRMAMDPATLGVSEAPLFESQADEVRIMTIHQSKGLEFPVVIIAGCALQEPSHSSKIRYDSALGLGISVDDQGERKDTFASLQILSRARQKQEAESLRLLYVAVTRARDQVIFAGEGIIKENTWRFALDAFLQSDKGHLIRPVFLPAASLPKTENLS